jgi:hypothetical protein
MLQHSGECEFVLRSQFSHCRLSARETREHRTPYRIGERTEGAVERRLIVYHKVNYPPDPVGRQGQARLTCAISVHMYQHVHD